LSLLTAGIGVANSYRRFIGVPTAGAIADRAYEEMMGVQTVDAGAVFTGLGLVFTLQGSPPAYVSINGAGLISVNTNISGPVGSASITVRGTNAAGYAEASFSISIKQPPRRPAVIRSQAVARSTSY
jgi:hypothetical protein